jgi:hypothetical protein
MTPLLKTDESALERRRQKMIQYRRASRKRQKAGITCCTVKLTANEIDKLIELGLLEARHRGNREQLGTAVELALFTYVY